MLIRPYTPADCEATARLFFDTVHRVNARDYTPEQLLAWAPGLPELTAWNASLLAHISLVALDGDTLTGFADMDAGGYLDRLFVHADRQGQGIASALCDQLEDAVSGDVTTHASLTARSFFEHRGYRVLQPQQVLRRGILLTNFVMRLAR